MNTISKGFTSFLSTAAAFEAPTETGKDVVNINGQINLAVELASQESEEMGETINGMWQAKEDLSRSVFALVNAMVETYGDAMDSFPIPDSKGGNNPDKFDAPKVDASGKTVMRPTSFYVHFFDATNEGKSLVKRLEMIGRRLDDKAKQDGIDQDILDMDRIAARALKEKLEARRSNARQAYKKAIAFYLQLNAINEMPGIEARILTDGDAVANTPRPVHVFKIAGTMKDAETGEMVNVPDPVKYDLMSVGGLMLLDVPKALEGGGTYDALMATKGRENKSGTGSQDGKNLPIVKTVDTFGNYLSSVAHYVEEVQNDKKQVEYTALLKALNDKGNDDLVESVFKLHFFLKDIVVVEKLAKRYQTIIAREEQADANKKLADMN